MLSEAFTLVLHLPPLAFGPALSPRAFDPPRALVCEIRDLGRVQAEVPLRWPLARYASLDPRTLKPAPQRHLLNPALEFMLVWGAMAATGGTWDDRSWSTRTWQATGASTPVLIPPQAPPIWALRR